MIEKFKCQIFFHMKIETSKTDEVYISGDIPELGKWDPLLSHKLETNEHDYPLWISPNPIILDQGFYLYNIE